MPFQGLIFASSGASLRLATSVYFPYTGTVIPMTLLALQLLPTPIFTLSYVQRLM